MSKIGNKHISFYCQNTNLLLPKQKISSPNTRYSRISEAVCLAPANKAANNVSVVWGLHYVNILKQELGATKAFELQPLIEDRSVVNDDTYHSATEFAVALNELGNRWCKREYVEHAAFKEWKLSMLRIGNKHISFYCQNTNLLLPKPKISSPNTRYSRISEAVCLAPANKAANNISVVWGLYYVNILKQELGATKAFELQPLIEDRSVVNDDTYHSATEFAVSVKEGQYKFYTL